MQLSLTYYPKVFRNQQDAASRNAELKSHWLLLKEMCTDIGLISEIWLKDTSKINEVLEDFTCKTGYSFRCKDCRKRREGGIAACFNTSKITMSKAKLPQNKCEIFGAIGRRTGQRQKIAVIVTSTTPNKIKAFTKL